MTLRHNTAWRNPGTMVGNRTVTGSEVDWSNPDNAKEEGTAKATAVAGAGEDTSGLAASNFDFSEIPAGSIITGIEVRLGAYTFPNASALVNVARLILADNSDGSENKQGEFSFPAPAETTDEGGGPEDLWSETGIDLAEVQDVDFGFFVSLLAAGPGGTFAVDFMQMRISYRLTTGWVFPGSMSGIRSIPSADVSWSDQDNAKADDGNLATAATVSDGLQTFGLAGWNFDFSAIPAGATIDGIEVRVGDYSASDANGTNSWVPVSLILADTSDGAEDKAAELSPMDETLQTDEAGGSTDLWTEIGIDRAEVQDSSFGFFVGIFHTGVGGPTLRVDFMQMRIHYHIGLPTVVHQEVAVPGHNPPHQSSGGAFYQIVYADNGGTGEALAAYKTTDPTDDPWAEQDNAGAPLMAGGLAPSVLSTVQNGDIIEIAWKISNTYTYSLFDMSTDEWWSAVSNTIDTIGADPSDQDWISIAARGGSEIVVNYNGETDRVMGGDKQRVDANVRSGSPPSWSGPIALDAAGDVHYGNPNCVLGTNDFVHCLWQTTSNTADPPTNWTDTEGRTIDPADDSLSVVDTSDGSTQQSMLGFPSAVSYDNGGTQEIVMTGFIHSSIISETIQGAEVSNEIVIAANSETTSFTTAPCFINGETSVWSMAALVDHPVLGSTIYSIYSGGGTLGVDQDLYFSRTIDEGASWLNPAEEMDGVTVNFISASIYLRGIDAVLAYAYDDGGVQKYNEKLLLAGPRTPFFFTQPKIGARYS